ncbi:hypothetical protein [Phycicoccus sp. 3266]|uniref:hypothetical protein n=1 Tax=Phycicoccus sp. 3266 TaxID=2817751 RepID=UPI0028565CD4|nr:hypothetical protein [Phycicoccus sp. 3266]MDR6862162.1 cation transport regulator ChaB [Phycicoccus sp. 3266]
MPRNTGCRCTVPISEVAPTTMYASDIEAWAALNGVRLVEDYLGRQAISLEDAYKVRERQKVAEAEAQRNAEFRAAVYTAQQQREHVYDRAFATALAGTAARREDLIHAKAVAWNAVAEAERDLPREVRDQLGGVSQSFRTIQPV